MSPHHSARIAAELDVDQGYASSATQAESLAFSWSKKQFHDRLDKAGVYRQKLKHFAVKVFLVDGIIVLFAVFGCNYLKQGSLALSNQYAKFLLIVASAWLLASLLFNKYHQEAFRSYQDGIVLITKSAIATLFLIINTLVLSGFYSYSRLQIIGTFGVYFALECAVFSVYYLRYGKRHAKQIAALTLPVQEAGHFSLFLLLSDSLILVASFFTVNLLKRGSLDLSPDYRNLLLIAGGIWFFIGLFTRKFEIRSQQNLTHIISPFWKSFLIMFSMMAITVYTFHLFSFSRTQVFGTLCLFFVAEMVFMFLYYLDWNEIKKPRDIHSVAEVKQAIQEDGYLPDLPRPIMAQPVPFHSVRSKLKERLATDNNGIYNFIAHHINLDEMHVQKTKILETDVIGEIAGLPDQSTDLVINLNPINDIQFMNRYFLTVHRKIYNGGYFVGKIRTSETYRSQFFAVYPKPIANLLYPLHFIYRGVLPRIPLIGKLYCLITQGRHQLLSKAEAMGRLYFCGFKVIAMKAIDHALYFIAQCDKNPSIEKNPSFKFIIKLKRIGMGGEYLYIRKFRTMYPYSEFLQDFIYQNNHLHANGKFNGDFRLTGWGKLLRKYWIDELPQLINFLQGDLGLVGVRALSEQYFNLYPKDLQQLRTKFKPGLIPPYYADLPKSFEEIIASERRYLDQKLEQPFTTDIRYFMKSVYNILFRRARSM